VTSDKNPYGACNFEVDLGGETVGFAEVNGLGCELEYAGKRVVSRVTEVTLRRGVSGDLTIWSWVRRSLDGAFAPRTVTITLLDVQMHPVCVWELLQARPVKWTGPALNAAGGGKIAMEELVLTAEGLEFKVPSTANPPSTVEGES